MTYAAGRGGIAARPGRPGFALPSEPLAGNSLPPWTGTHSDGWPAGRKDAPGPHPASQPLGGQTGDTDGYTGADPSRPKTSPYPASPQVGAWGEGDVGTTAATQSFRRYGLQGFNDRLQWRDRHAYYDAGTQRFRGPGPADGRGSNPQLGGPPRPDLRTVNRSVNPQAGSDATRNQDDLGRPYTWLGQADGTVVPVYGGVPGLYQPYGTRGGVPYPIVDPTGGQGGPIDVHSGPPHGLHSDTLPGAKLLRDRYAATPQMRPPRLDRPDNSRIAGQSYSQTVQRQGGTTPSGGPPRGGAGLGVSLRLGSRGWGGSQT